MPAVLEACGAGRGERETRRAWKAREETNIHTHIHTHNNQSQREKMKKSAHPLCSEGNTGPNWKWIEAEGDRCAASLVPPTCTHTYMHTHSPHV